MHLISTYKDSASRAQYKTNSFVFIAKAQPVLSKDNNKKAYTQQ